MKNGRVKEKGSCRTVCILCLSPTFIAAILVVAWRPILLPYSVKYLKMVVSHIVNDKQRFLDNELLFAHKEWKFYQMETRFGQDWCKEHGKSRSNVTWLTVMVGDEYITPALTLGDSIRTFSCQQNMTAFISKSVSEETRNVLQSVGWDTRLVEEMDCNWMDVKVGGDRNSGLLGRPSGHRIRGTHTRFHAWNYTEFSKIIYVDADYLLMTNVDELFDIPEDFAAVPCSRPGVLDPCFNAGLLVFRPDTRHYQEIMKLWWETTEKGTCPTDQELLNDYYTDVGSWKALPFAYNIRRFVFRPMNSFHFLYCRPPKPWSAECRPSRKEASGFQGPILATDDMVLVFWKKLYELLKKYKLENWWRSTKFFRPTQEFGFVRYADCLKQTNISNPKKWKEMFTRLNHTKSTLIDRFNSILFCFRAQNISEGQIPNNR